MGPRLFLTMIALVIGVSSLVADTPVGPATSNGESSPLSPPVATLKISWDSKRAGSLVKFDPEDATEAQSVRIKRNEKSEKDQVEVPVLLEALDKDGKPFTLTETPDIKLWKNGKLDDSFKPSTAANQPFVVSVDLKEPTTTLQIKWTDAAKGNQPNSNELKLTLDETGPLPVRVLAERQPFGQVRVSISLADDDLPSILPAANKFEFKRQIYSGEALREEKFSFLGLPTFDRKNRTLALDFAALAPGNYQVTIKALEDRLGNSGADKDLAFVVPAGPQQGRQIDFPEFLPPGNQAPRDGDFNPNDKVDTRVLRLYYYRDAHRIAEIINRNVQRLNQPAVDQAHLLAQTARREANEATDERRYSEAKAVQAANEAREARKQTQSAEATRAAAIEERTTLMGVAKNAETRIIDYQNQIDDIGPQISANSVKIAELKSLLVDDPANQNLQMMVAALEDLNRQLTAEQDRLTQEKGKWTEYKSAIDTKTATLQTRINDADTAISSSQTNLADAQAKQQQAQNDLLKLQATEDRKQETLFQLEVAAGKTDPNTYAAAQTASLDPVAQVSISVVGEGLLHLRGPTKGINKIARIVHQLDTPVGQVKVGIHTIQVNGEHGDRMELVYERIEKHIAHARFLSHESTQLFRKAVAMVAAEVALEVDQGFVPPHCEELFACDSDQFTREMRYMYGFFGKDFLDELARMDSVLLKSDNKLLALHSMDTISLSGAMLNTGLARNDVRMRIISLFQAMATEQLPMAEMDYYRALTHVRKADPVLNSIATQWFQRLYDKKDAKRIWNNAARTYQFTNFVGFFNTTFPDGDTINNVQFAVIRLAQALKAQLIAELEFKNVVLERSLLEKDKGDINVAAQKAQTIREDLEKSRKSASQNSAQFRVEIDAALDTAIAFVKATVQEEINSKLSSRNETLQELAVATNDELFPKVNNLGDPSSLQRSNYVNDVKMFAGRLLKTSNLGDEPINGLVNQNVLDGDTRTLKSFAEAEPVYLEMITAYQKHLDEGFSDKVVREKLVDAIIKEFLARLATATTKDAKKNVATNIVEYSIAYLKVDGLQDNQKFLASRNAEANRIYEETIKELRSKVIESVDITRIVAAASGYIEKSYKMHDLKMQLDVAVKSEQEWNEKLFAKRLLDQFIDEQEEKSVELSEAMRSHVANVDNYLKRLAIALEDDINAQFYNPAFQDIRRASRYWDVQLGQVETTTILTNNRTFAKVSPNATIEFDLPERDILITEAFKDAKALVTEYGALTTDPTFLSATTLLGPQSAPGIPGSDQPLQRLVDSQRSPQFGAALEGLIPDPAIYKFETGTGFEIRPVIQPDGHSIIYNFNYMYTTNVREPVNADEKHLGRVKRHFVHTDVQTSSYEIREVSRYMVALKASRTSRGVPLLEDVPLVGGLFRPLPSQESSLQENIILAASTIYPTVYDLMGLRWSPYADELNSTSLAQQKDNQLHRRQEMRNQLLSKTRRLVNERIGIPNDARVLEPAESVELQGSMSPAASRAKSGTWMPSKQRTQAARIRELLNSTEAIEEESNASETIESLPVPPVFPPQTRRRPTTIRDGQITPSRYEAPARTQWTSIDTSRSTVKVVSPKAEPPQSTKKKGFFTQLKDKLTGR